MVTPFGHGLSMVKRLPWVGGGACFISCHIVSQVNAKVVAAFQDVECFSKEATSNKGHRY